MHVPQQQQQQQQQPAAAAAVPAHHRIPNAVEILGPYIDSPVVSQMLNSISHNVVVAREQLLSLRAILDKVPEARDDMQVFTRHLQQGSQSQTQQGAS